MMNPAWNWQPIGELFRFGAGKTMSAAARTGTHKTLFLRTSNVLWDQIDLSNVDQMAMSPGELEEKSLRPGDLLVCEGGNIGRAAMWNGQLPLMSFQNHLHRLRHIHGNVHVRFYVYFLQSAFTQLGLFDGAGNKTTIPNLSRNQLAALRVPVPPLNEQRAISDSLRTIRTAIAYRAKTILLAEELKQATMARLFTCGLRDEPQQQTAIGIVPTSWHVCTLADVCKNQGSVV
ncbi:MAG: restriction endonuclease subunit S, partial [Polyangiaceae bacterium]|nr:restriction endonuclease subunit S [Polyangiaceae bacterium]